MASPRLELRSRLRQIDIVDFTALIAKAVVGLMTAGLAVTFLNWLGCIPLFFGRSPIWLPFLSTIGNGIGALFAPTPWFQAISGVALLLDPINYAYFSVARDGFRHSRFTRIRSWSGATLRLSLHDNGDFVLIQNFTPLLEKEGIGLIRRGMVGRWFAKDGTLSLVMNADTATFSIVAESVIMTKWFDEDQEPAPLASTLLQAEGQPCWSRTRMQRL